MQVFDSMLDLQFHNTPNVIHHRVMQETRRAMNARMALELLDGFAASDRVTATREQLELTDRSADIALCHLRRATRALYNTDQGVHWRIPVARTHAAMRPMGAGGGGLTKRPISITNAEIQARNQMHDAMVRVGPKPP